MAGYIKIDRKILKWEWWSDINTFRLFSYMLLASYWKNGNYKGKEILRGSFPSSISELSRETNLTDNEVRTAIKHLKSTGEITSKSYNKFTVFTVKNYDFYQSDNEQNYKEITSKNTSKPQTDNELLTSKSQAINEQITNLPIIKESKKEIREKGKNEKTEEYKRIVEYMNRKCGTRYRYQTANTQKCIHARFADGYTEEDFYTVIDKKCSEWIGTERERFLRPETLFGAKFESYLNQKISYSGKNSDSSAESNENKHKSEEESEESIDYMKMWENYDWGNQQ